VAIEVPSHAAQLLSGTDDVIATPGAHTAISGPKQVKRAEKNPFASTCWVSVCAW
jgi:hypothetical protein